MKKLLALVFALMLSFSCTLAEDLPFIVMDPELLAPIEGGYVLFEEFGLQMYMPASFVQFEVSEEGAAQGVRYNFGREDGSLLLHVGLAGVADTNGNLITNTTDLTTYHQAMEGVTAAEIVLNGLQCMTFEAPAVNKMGMAYSTADGYVVTFNFVFTDFEADKVEASLLLMSICLPE